MRNSTRLALVLLAALVLPASASAKLLSLDRVFYVRGAPVTVAHRGVLFSGYVRPYAPGQVVTVRAYEHHRLVAHGILHLHPSPDGTFGYFRGKVAAPSVGLVTIFARHAKNAALASFVQRRSFSALDENVGPGSIGRFVVLIQQRLAALHVWTPQSGIFDAGTLLAIDAYHRLLRWGTSPRLGPATVAALLNGSGGVSMRFPRHGHHAEGDLTRQLLFLADGPTVRFIFPISSGKPSTPTVLGDYRIYRRSPGLAPDGMYYSSYFTGGYAIHGFDPAPDYPASHGCMRLPIPDAIPVYDWLGFGDWVDVYYE